MQYKHSHSVLFEITDSAKIALILLMRYARAFGARGGKGPLNMNKRRFLAILNEQRVCSSDCLNTHTVNGLTSIPGP